MENRRVRKVTKPSPQMEYKLTSKSSSAEILEVLSGMHKDCELLAGPEAIRAVVFNDQESREDVLMLMAKKSLLGSLIWALSGQAEEDGVDSTIDVTLK